MKENRHEQDDVRSANVARGMPDRLLSSLTVPEQACRPL